MATESAKERLIREEEYAIHAKYCKRCGCRSNSSLFKCAICGEHVCLGCMYIPVDDRLWDIVRGDNSLHVHGSYTWCCKRCWKTGEARVRFLDAEEDKFLGTVKSEIDAWKREVTQDA